MCRELCGVFNVRRDLFDLHKRQSSHDHCYGHEPDVVLDEFIEERLHAKGFLVKVFPNVNEDVGRNDAYSDFGAEPNVDFCHHD